ncbi:MAG TPA: tRNA 4-thiouridine(8) synthase ThiI [bacterium]|nr:tRNA 4-thiouridine(8) synthase ThiI [bacterium]
MKEKTCLALFSGGLDSLLAIKLMMMNGFKVIVLNFNTGFYFNAYRREGGELYYKAPVPPGFDVRVIDISGDFLQMLKNPAHGFGKNMNPCIDCKIYMLRKAGELMEKFGAGFVITGEVLGQRPMTQNIRAIKLIEKESGLSGYLLRPLSAKCLAPTEPEKAGWVDREKLFDIQGRTRKRQLALAAGWGLSPFVKPPGGGCILTEKAYSKRLRNFLERAGSADITEDDMKLLRTGRHFIKDGAGFITGRNEEENRFLSGFRGKAVIFEARGAPGPVTITFDNPGEEIKNFIAAVTAGYSDARNLAEAVVEVLPPAPEPGGLLKVKPVLPEKAKEYFI